MQRSNVELVREVMAVYERDGWEGVVRYAEPDIEIRMGAGINEGTRKGIEEGLAFTADWEEAWGEASYELAEVEEIDPETLCARVESAVRGAGSGVEVTFTQWWVYGIRDGKFYRWELYYDRESASEAARA